MGIIVEKENKNDAVNNSEIAKEAVMELILVCSALSDKEFEFKLQTVNKNIKDFIDCLETLGAGIEITEDNICRVIPFGINNENNSGFLPILNCRNNQAALRLLIPVMAALKREVFVSGTGELAKTSFDDMRILMEARGSEFRYDHFPFELCGELTAGRFEFEEASSPLLIAGIMIAAPLLCEDSQIIIQDNLSNKLIWTDATEAALTKFGISFNKSENGYTFKGNQRYVTPEA